MTTLDIISLLVVVATAVWSARHSAGAAYQKHIPHPSHFIAYLVYAIVLSAWGIGVAEDSGKPGPLVLVAMGIYFLWKSFLAFRAWRRDDVIEL